MVLIGGGLLTWFNIYTANTLQRDSYIPATRDVRRNWNSQIGSSPERPGPIFTNKSFKLRLRLELGLRLGLSWDCFPKSPKSVFTNVFWLRLSQVYKCRWCKRPNRLTSRLRIGQNGRQTGISNADENKIAAVDTTCKASALRLGQYELEGVMSGGRGLWNWKNLRTEGRHEKISAETSARNFARHVRNRL